MQSGEPGGIYGVGWRERIREIDVVCATYFLLKFVTL